MKLLLLLFLLWRSPSYVPALRCRSCTYVSPPTGLFANQACLNSSFPEQVCADYEDHCMAINTVAEVAVLRLELSIGGCYNSSYCQGEPFDYCDNFNMTAGGTVKSCSYWCCSEDLCNYVDATKPSNSTQLPTATLSIHPTAVSTVQQHSTAVSTAQQHSKAVSTVQQHSKAVSTVQQYSTVVSTIQVEATKVVPTTHGHRKNGCKSLIADWFATVFSASTLLFFYMELY
ncbi:uncharacterized protein LOC144629782 [Oculina patagonica]